MEEDLSRLSVWVNPLQFFPIDFEHLTPQESSITAEDILQYLCGPTATSDVASWVQRYRQISQGDNRLFAAPAEERILQKLIWPLRHAKGAYCLGNYLATIALSGIVAEMVALLFFNTADINLNNNPMDDRLQKDLFGASFERLGQDRRVIILKAYGIIDNADKEAFNTIRDKRRRYLHFYSQPHKQLEDDALVVYWAARDLVIKVIGQDVRNGVLVLRPAMARYLESTGVVKSSGWREDDDT